MSDQEAKDNPESFIGAEEKVEAHDPNVGDGSPATAPHELPEATFVEKLRDVLVRNP